MFVGPITDNVLNWILVRVAKAKGIEVTADDASHLSVDCQEVPRRAPALRCGRLQTMIGVCDYEGVPKKLDTAMIDRVASVYFLQGSGRRRPDGAASPTIGSASWPGAIGADRRIPRQHHKRRRPRPNQHQCTRRTICQPVALMIGR
ncbi:MAG: hypothetical protein R2706_08905 [Acidimicrobiales bacterium]